MRNFLATLALLAIMAGVGFYAAGWMTYHKDDNTATINIRTKEIERAAERTIDKSKNLLEDAIDHPVHKLDPVPVPETRPVTPINPDETQPVKPVKPVDPDLDGPVT